MMNIHDVYRPILLHFRRKRMAQFVDMFSIQDRTQLLDVGGSTFNWQMIDREPKVTILNIDLPKDRDSEQFTFVQGDARALPYSDKEFGLVYSNSVIEHVGGPEDQKRFAEEVRRVGASYYVQTPYKYFFVEPHFITVGLQWLPFFIKRRLLRWCSVWGLITRPTQAEVDALIREIRLLTIHDMKSLFPDATILIERWLFIPKSIIAVKHG
jgi:hypothetical protein